MRNPEPFDARRARTWRRTGHLLAALKGALIALCLFGVYYLTVSLLTGGWSC